MLSRIFRLSFTRSRSSPLGVERSYTALSSRQTAVVGGSVAFNASVGSQTNHQFCHDVNSSYQGQCLAFSTRTRRRRRGGGTPFTPKEDHSDASRNDNKSTSASPGAQYAALSSEQFQDESIKLLDKVESAVTELKDSNEGLEITRYPPSTGSGNTDAPSTDDDDDESDPRFQQHGGQLSIQVQSSGDLYWGGGTYWLTINNASDDGSGGSVTLLSPLSGNYSYVYNASTCEWVGDEDGHSLLGMLTRDWIRQCQGVPNF